MPDVPDADPSGARWEAVPGLAQVASEGRVVILDPSRPAQPPVILEHAAAAIWTALATHPVLADLISELRPVAIPGDQVAGFLAALEDAGLVRRTQ
ncbi:hypothetical protein [Nocardioides cavernaquae]|uniref:PqqD family protein n=1 Tax=Nocardioides cavernaquae TaxID=2321396 RepID=A0A3A5H699_9ACTN|nr:hypothetical protein [Nocardioides cavernaquae]RJS45388.1 hypothetical protein D4739_03580 [Nocardioides cavernaquae]